jgi:hypothetical protein
MKTRKSKYRTYPASSENDSSGDSSSEDMMPKKKQKRFNSVKSEMDSDEIETRSFQRKKR